MHIAIINSEYPSPSGSDHGGIATYCYTMANALTALGHNVELLLRYGTIPEELPDSVRVHFYRFKQTHKAEHVMMRFRKNNSSWEFGHSIDIMNILLNIHKDDKLDIVEFPDYGGLSFACKATMPFPVVINFHTPSVVVDNINNIKPTPPHKSLYSFEKKSIRRANAFRCPSNSLKSEVCNLYKIPESDICLIRNPVDTRRFDCLSNVTPDDQYEILFAGRLERRKGAEILIKSIASILDIDDRIHFTFAGNAEPGGNYQYRCALEQTLSKKQRSRVFFSGPLTRERLSILFCRSSLFLFPSIFENAPYALFEAMAAGLPVIASDSSGIKEIIKHNENGLLFNPGDTGELITCIKKAINDYASVKQMTQAAYNHLKQNHDPQKIAEETIAFYQSIIARFRK